MSGSPQRIPQTLIHLVLVCPGKKIGTAEQREKQREAFRHFCTVSLLPASSWEVITAANTL